MQTGEPPTCPISCRTSSISRRNSAPITTRPSRSCSRGARACGCGMWTATDISIASPAYSAVNQGHCHPKIYQALVDQARTLTLTSRAFHNDQLALFYKELCELTRSHKVLPMNSGAEAVESAIKTVRKWGYEMKGVPGGPGRDHRLPQQLPRPDHRHHRLQQRSAARRVLWSVCAWIQSHPVRRRRCAAGRHHPRHRWLSRRADPGGSRRDHPYRWLPARGSRDLQPR